MPSYSGYLICSAAGNMRLLQKPTTRPNEYAVKVAFDLPGSLFVKPVLRMKATVEPIVVPEITPELVAKAQQLLDQVLPIKLALEVELPIMCPTCGGSGCVDDPEGGSCLVCELCGGSGLPAAEANAPRAIEEGRP